MRIVDLRDLAKVPLNVLESSLQRWKSQDEVRFRLANFKSRCQDSVVCDLISRLVFAGAFVGMLHQKGYEIMADTATDTCIVRELEEAQLAVCTSRCNGNSSWLLMRECMQLLVPHRSVSRPILVSEICNDALPLLSRSVYELMKLLHADGLMWRRLPPHANQRARLRYTSGDEKVWFTNSFIVEASYLVCLIEAATLLDRGVPCIEHGQPRQYYKAILDGKQPK